MSEAAAWPEPDWEPVQPFPFAAARGVFAGMTSTEDSILLHYYRRPDRSLAAVAEFGRRAEGAPGLVHGGAILPVLDEALGAAAWLAGRPVMTASLDTEFRKGLPIGMIVHVETRLLRERHRLVFLEGSLSGRDGTLYARASGRYIVLDDATLRRLFGRTP